MLYDALGVVPARAWIGDAGNMGMIELPFFARCTIGSETFNKLPILEMNDYTVKVRLPNGDIVKRSFRKHDVEITYVSPDLEGKGEH
jgi:hypothetical protein